MWKCVGKERGETSKKYVPGTHTRHEERRIALPVLFAERECEQFRFDSMPARGANQFEPKIIERFFLHVVFSTRTKQRRRRERNLFSQRVAKGKSCFIPFFIRQKQKKQLIETLFSHSIRSKSKHVLNRINKKNIIIYQ